jgi:electron transfer flavoprotein alpha subunit
MEVERKRVRLSGSVDEQVAAAVTLLEQWGALEGSWGARLDGGESGADPVRSSDIGRASTRGPVVTVVAEPGRKRLVRELLGEAAQLAGATGGSVTCFCDSDWAPGELDAWGADRVVSVGARTEQDVAGALASWCGSEAPWAVLVPGTLWGREVAGRCASRIGAGLTGDAVGFGVEDGRLVSWKPAFGGRLVAAITTSSPVQMATVRPGVLELRSPRAASGSLPVEHLAVVHSGRVEVLAEGRDDDVETLLSARVVVGVGTGVHPEEYDALQPLLKVLRAELGASRKVTDKGWLPRSRQVGITGHSIAPALYVALGVQGKFNHVIGTRSAGTVLAVNLDEKAPIFDWADVGIVADWRDAVPALVAALESSRS